jgi:beta-glucanase (GH16 family)
MAPTLHVRGGRAWVVHACVVAAIVLLASLLVSPQVEAARARVTLKAPIYLKADQVRLTGKASRSIKRVRVQERRGSRWVSIGKARVKRGKYSTVVRRGAAPKKVRVVARKAKSRARVLRPLSADACGVRPFKPDGSEWRCTLVDNFNGSSLNRALWKPQTNFATGDATASACYLDDPSLISVGGGTLRLSVRKASGLGLVVCTALLPSPLTAYMAGMVSTHHMFSQQYGRFEARMKSQAATGPGLHEAFWLWPDERQVSVVKWPAAGEIDIVETYSNHPDLAIPFLHYTLNDNGGPVPGLNTAYCAAKRGVFNTYTLVWTPRILEISVNGRLCLRNTSGDVAFQKPYIVLFTQAMGHGTNAYRGQTSLPATMQVDYVRVWK